MPKDATKNVDRYKVKGGELNEFDFHQNQEEFAERRTQATSLIPGTPPEAKAERLKTLTNKAASKKDAKARTAKKAAKKK